MLSFNTHRTLWNDEWIVTSYEFGSRAHNRASIAMIHSRGCSGAQFFRTASTLAHVGYHVIVIDLPGHGQSDYPPIHEPGWWSVKSLACAVRAAIMQHVSERYILFGHSLGGVIALEALQYYGNEIHHLITMGTHLEMQSVPDRDITLDHTIRRLLGDSELYSLFMWAVWCKGSRATYRALCDVWKSSGGHDVERDMTIISQVPRNYDYRNRIELYESENSGIMSLIDCTGDTLIRKGLGPSLAFMRNNPIARVVAEMNDSHFSHLTHDGLASTIDKLVSER